VLLRRSCAWVGAEGAEDGINIHPRGATHVLGGCSTLRSSLDGGQDLLERGIIEATQVDVSSGLPRVRLGLVGMVLLRGRRVGDRWELAIAVASRGMQLGLGFGSGHDLSGNLGLQILVLVEARVVSTSRPVKGLERDLGHGLRAVVELRHGKNPLDNLSLNHKLPWEARVEKHDIHLQTSFEKGTLNPSDEVSVDLLKQ
jgi:hypothetical protein